ncbi:type II toxin-antitoxin system prevent-host-death family antitoxin [Methylomonas albis]|uniref:Type II toxin-antitoxin system prevent-host-death family antitoxin n=1 Tax=Methylomonas albis TaxID=1854563 RepID=A0ABR9CV44_9GAMM|nr:type II toxin-antitoxin system prevent-host-death family antitoxin [Methylomonas albis]MBD9354692.1 type II toxin-antitoxin system prevent-host-death family antitoxin [Methylomonas albis]
MNAQPQFITNANGEKTAVILPIADYQELMEDLADLAAIAERKDEPNIPFEAALSEIGL